MDSIGLLTKVRQDNRGPAKEWRGTMVPTDVTIFEKPT